MALHDRFVNEELALAKAVTYAISIIAHLMEATEYDSPK
jgi:hypothetical protein